MVEIDTSDWIEFRLIDVADVEMGNGFDFGKMRPNGDGVLFIGRTGVSNGCMGLVEEVESVEPYEAGLMTVALGGSIGATFVQDDPFYTSQNVAVVRFPDGVDDNAKRFVAALVQKESSLNYKAFVKELNKHLRKDFTIKLPATRAGDPDWDTMEQMMSQVFADRAAALDTLITLPGGGFTEIDTSGWGEFHVEGLFERIERGKAVGAGALMDGDVPYIAASFANNGFVRGIEDKDGSLMSEGNCIAFICNGNGGVGRNTYQSETFAGSGDLQLGYHHRLTKLSGLFLVSCLDKSIERYSYSFAWKRTGAAFASETVFLPVDTDGDPDWSAMEQMMSAALTERETVLDSVEVFAGVS